MPPVDNQIILELIEEELSNQYADTPDIIDEGLGIASDFLYGTNDIQGVSHVHQDFVSTEDYFTFRDAICNNNEVLDFYEGNENSDPIFFEVRDTLDRILQEQLGGLNRGLVNLWGECGIIKPFFVADESYAYPLPVTTSLPKTAKQKSKKSTTKSNYPISQTNTSTTTSTNPTTSSPKNNSSSSPQLADQAYCDDLSQSINKEGAYLLHIGNGFICEYNYNPISSGKIIFADINGISSAPKIFQYFERQSKSLQSPRQLPLNHPPIQQGLGPLSQNQSVEFSMIPNEPASKAKSLDDLVKLWQNGASESEINHIFRYRGDVPEDVDDPNTLPTVGIGPLLP